MSQEYGSSIFGNAVVSGDGRVPTVSIQPRFELARTPVALTVPMATRPLPVVPVDSALPINRFGRQARGTYGESIFGTRVGMGAPDPTMETFWGVASVASMAASAYHGYKRNDSVGWALWWGLCGGLFPIIVPVIAVAQGFGKKAK